MCSHCDAAHDGQKASWIIESCRYIIVDGHHRHCALKRIYEEYGEGVSHQLCPKKVSFPAQNCFFSWYLLKKGRYICCFKGGQHHYVSSY
jgi:hypothetical protein